MLNIYEENSLVIASRKNLFSEPHREEADFTNDISFYKEIKGAMIYLPACFIDQGEDGTVLRYCYSKKMICSVFK